MAQLYASIAFGTAATMMATILLLLRAEFNGRRPLVALTRRWVATSARASGLVVALLFAVAASCFAIVSANDGASFGVTPATAVDASAMQGDSMGLDGSNNSAQALDALRAYAGDIDGGSKSTPPSSASTGLPDVDTMIGKLFARLEKQPDDVKGWKMLGWSYMNTGRTDEAVTAYETALKLAPGDAEIAKALNQAKSMPPASIPESASAPSSHPVHDAQSTTALSDSQQNDMIRGMVDQLATRLSTSPKDEDGWSRLMRSRMALGEKEAAKAALTKALETFAGDDAVKTRLAATARELGVESE